MSLDMVERIVVVLMENRSFDHMLGYLSLPPYSRANVDGQRSDDDWKSLYANPYQGEPYKPFRLEKPSQYIKMDGDPPHDADSIGNQMGAPSGGVFPMLGYVENYAHAKEAPTITPAHPPPVMGYFGPEEAPITDFFAQNFAVCDHWFAALPAGTHPNRLMAMSGYTLVDKTQIPLPRQELVYEWLKANDVTWRVYHAVVPFFAMMPNWTVPVLTDDEHFRRFEQLQDDLDNEPPDAFPQVIFIEPAYNDCPHIGETSDDHSPAPIKGGQQFLLDVYRMISESALWGGTVMIVTYDEHGGFFDHVSPPACITEPLPGSECRRFGTLGIRVPAFVISPFVTPGSVCNEVFDHTSILKFIGEKFGPGGRYSDRVNDRRLADGQPLSSVQAVLDATDAPREAPGAPSLVPYMNAQADHAGRTPGTAPDSDLQDGFEQAFAEIRQTPGADAKFGDLIAAFPVGAGGQ